MAMPDRILLVEGEADRSFFEQICKALHLHANVKVAPPKLLGGSHNTKEGVFNHLPVLLKQLADGQITHLAVVVDADSAAHGGGCQRAIDRIEGIVAPFGFKPATDSRSGVVLRHDDGLADFGLWVMPDNRDEGMLEDWVKRCIHRNEQALFAHAATVVAALPQPRFKPIHRSKAEVATWLAWQKSPGHGPYRALEDHLIDVDSPLFQSLDEWLTRIFPRP